MPTVEIDEAFGLLLDQAVSSWQADRPRTKQKTLGPSSVGGCREYIRATIAGDDGIEERGRGVDAAFIGTVVGDAIEEILKQYLGVETQVDCVATLPKTKLVIGGNSDLVWIDQGVVGDLKGCDSLAEVKYDLERNGFKRGNKYFKYAVQIAIYVLALVQAGKLKPGATARLIFFQRDGKAKKFLVVPIGWQALMRFIDEAEKGLMDVQNVLAKGSPEESRWNLRDQDTSLCFYTQCEFRMNCWGGSEWVPNGVLNGAGEIEVVDKFVDARERRKEANALYDSMKEEVRAIAPEGGKTPKHAVSWQRNGSTLQVIPL